MPNLAVALKEEIRRLARKEIKTATQPTRLAVSQYRRDIARLKKILKDQDRKMAALRAEGRATFGAADVPGPREATRFSSRSVRAQRRRLRLSAQQYARLVGVTALTVYNWEHGKTRPLPKQMAALVAVRGIGKREAKARLEAAAAATARKPR